MKSMDTIQLSETGPAAPHGRRALWALADIGRGAAKTVMVITFGPALWLGFVVLG